MTATKESNNSSKETPGVSAVEQKVADLKSTYRIEHWPLPIPASRQRYYYYCQLPPVYNIINELSY